MTDNEIIKALEYCDRTGNCCGCPYGRCIEVDLNELVLSIINRQKAEIERLTDTLNATIAGQETLQRYIQTAKTEAIKEFSERLKERKSFAYAQYGKVHYTVSEDDIDNLVKEMVGDDNG